MRAGGWWQCRIRKLEASRRTDQARRDVKVARQRARYDADPIYRIEKVLHDSARRRRATLERRRAALLTDREGDSHSSLPPAR
jgi:hypothetical protein